MSIVLRFYTCLPLNKYQFPIDIIVNIRSKFFQSFPHIKQTHIMECGSVSLAIVLKHYGFENVKEILFELTQVDTEGTDLFAISEVAEDLGFETAGFEITFDVLQEIQLPCIAHCDGNHFLVVYKADDEKVWISDPANTRYSQSRKEFERRWSGIVLEMKPKIGEFAHGELMEMVQERQKKLKSVFREFYLPILHKYKKVFFEVVLASFVIQTLGLAVPYFTQTIIDDVLVFDNSRLLYVILLAMVSVFVLQIILGYIRNVIISQMKVEVELDFFSNFFHHMIHLKMRYFDATRKEEFMNRYYENLSIRQVVSPNVIEGVVDSVFMILYFIALFVYSSQLALIAIGIATMYFLMLLVFTPKIIDVQEKAFSQNVKTLGRFLDALLGIQTVKLLNIEKLRFWKWRSQYINGMNTILKEDRIFIGFEIASRSLYQIGSLGVLWLGAYYALRGELTIGEYIAFTTLFTIILGSLQKMAGLWISFAELSVTFKRLNDVLVQENQHESIFNLRKAFVDYNISVKQLKFKYQERDDNYSLFNVDLEVPHGQKIGVVGRNGSGKSTFVKVLSKLYDGYQGSVEIGGENIHNYYPRLYQQKVVMLPQDIYIFDGTVRENILYAKPTASNEELICAAELADLDGFLKENLLGFNLRVGSYGANISGGQRLKIGFARLFLQRPEIIILDEASSALDVETEQKIFRNIDKEFCNQTIFIVAHRLNTLKNVDRILVLEKGELVEDGSLDELMQKKGLFYSFMNTYVNF